MRRFVLHGRELPQLVVGEKSWGRQPAEPLLEAVRESGVLVDTAEIYGRGASEASVGRNLPDNPVITKFWPWPWRMPGGVGRRVDASLRRLQRPQVELLLLHVQGLMFGRGFLRALSREVEAGKARGLGVCNHLAGREDWMLDYALSQRIPLSALHVHASITETRAMRSGLVQRCKELGIAVMAFRVLGAGALVGRGPSSQRERQAAQELREVSQISGLSPAACQIVWLMEHGLVPILGTRSAPHFREALDACSRELPGAAMDRLDRFAGLR